jgi:hypothetical protein
MAAERHGPETPTSSAQASTRMVVMGAIPMQLKLALQLRSRQSDTLLQRGWAMQQSSPTRGRPQQRQRWWEDSRRHIPSGRPKMSRVTQIRRYVPIQNRSPHVRLFSSCLAQGNLLLRTLRLHQLLLRCVSVTLLVSVLLVLRGSIIWSLMMMMCCWSNECCTVDNCQD